MIQDIQTIIQKEIKESVAIGSPRGRGKFGLVLIFAVLGILMPLQLGEMLISSNISLFLWGWVPMLLISAVIADSFAGERERHTLETLLATRLTDRAILFGKMFSGVLYGIGITWILIGISLITINVANFGGGLLIFSPTKFAAIALVSFLTSFLATSLGVLVSLRAESVRQAQQTISMLIFVLFIPVFALGILPDDLMNRVNEFLASVNPEYIILAGMMFLFGLDIVLVFLCIKRFNRNQLTLENP